MFTNIRKLRSMLVPRTRLGTVIRKGERLLIGVRLISARSGLAMTSFQALPWLQGLCKTREKSFLRLFQEQVEMLSKTLG